MARVLITGSAGGLGREAARLLVGAGHEVVLHARDEARTREALAAVPGAAAALAGDLASIAQTTELAHRANESGAFDAVIHNAGIGYREPRRIETEDGLAHVFQVNVLAPYLLTALVRRPGRLIYLSSGIASARPQATWTVAASICGAVEALTRALAVELAPIRVNAVAPGVVRSNLWRDMSEDDRSAMYASLAQALPAGRAGEVDDVAETVLYLMRNGYSTGTVVTIDGGSVLV